MRVGFDELDKRILPDMGVKVAFQENAAQDEVTRAGVLVPPAALRGDGGRSYVLIVNGGALERRAVTSGGERGGNILVTAGLSGGESVVIGGPAELADGDRVKEIFE